MQEQKTYYSKGLARAYSLAHNCALALELAKDMPQETEGEFLPPIKRTKGRKTYSAVCAWHRCPRKGEPFTSNTKRQSYCSKECRNCAGVWKYNRHKQLAKAKKIDARIKDNAEWQNYFTREMFGYEGSDGLPLIPPKLRGRPTQEKRKAIDAYRAKLNRFKLRREIKELKI